MATKTNNQPDQNSIYDDKTPARTKGDNLEDKFNAPSATDQDLPEYHPSRASNALSPDDLEQAEESGAGNPENSPSTEEQNQFFNPSDKPPKRGRFKITKNLIKKKRLLFAGGGLAFAFIGGLFAIVTFLLPFKLTHILETIEQRVGNVPEYAIERRLEYYMNRYLIVRQLQVDGKIPDKFDDASKQYTFLGDGVFKTLYTNWRGAKLEAKMAQKYGVNIKTNIPSGEAFGRKYLKPISWTVTFEGHDRELNLGSSREARSFIRDFVKTETRSRQVIKRHHMRKILRRYYGINNWKVFESQRESARKSYLEKKLALKKYLVRQTMGRISTRYALWLNCLLEGGEKCKEIRQGNTPANERDGEFTNENGDVVGGGGTEEANAAAKNPVINEIAEEGGDVVTEILDDNAAKNLSEKALGKQIAKKLQEVGLKKVLASFAVGIGILDTISQIEKSLEDGTLNIVVYDKNAQQYAAFTAPFLSMADQIRSGEDVDAVDTRVANEVLDGFAESPVYQGALKSANSLPSSSQIRRDCDNDGSTSGKEDLLEPGETVCSDKRLVQDKTTFTNSDGWKIFHGIAETYRSSLGKIVGVFNKIVETAFEITGLDKAIQAVMDATGLSNLAASGFRWIMNRVAGPVLTGAETGPDAYDALYAGVAVQKSSLGGGVGANREDTIGGAYLSPQQIAAISAEQEEDIDNEIQRSGYFARYFSPSNTNSLISKLIIKTPGSFSGFSQNVAKFDFKPLGIFSGFSSLFSPRVSAQDFNVYNPFHAVYYGYSPDELTTLEEMEPDELISKYACNEPDLSKRPQNQVYTREPGLPFDVATKTDPCLLEESVEKAGSMYFDGNYDQGL